MACGDGQHLLFNKNVENERCTVRGLEVGNVRPS